MSDRVDMTDEQAEYLMERLIQRFERDGAIHKSAGKEELIMGWRALHPLVAPQQAPVDNKPSTAPPPEPSEYDLSTLDKIKKQIDEVATKTREAANPTIGTQEWLLRDMMRAIEQRRNQGYYSGLAYGYGTGWTSISTNTSSSDLPLRAVVTNQVMANETELHDGTIRKPWTIKIG